MIKNTFFSLLNKGINALVPLLLIPICNKLFGIVSYGEMIYFQSLVGLVVTLSDYGFSVTGLKSAAQQAKNPIALGKLFTEVTYIKLVMLLVGAVGLVVYLMFFKQKQLFNTSWLLFTFVFGSLAIQSLLPFWLYQGLKKNFEMAIINLIAKGLLVIFIIIWVYQSKNIFNVALAEMLTYIVALILSLILLSKNIYFPKKIPKVEDIKQQLTVGFDFFIIVLIYWMINGGSMLFVEYYTNGFELGFFAIFLRFSYYVFTIFQPVIHALIPYFADKFEYSERDGYLYYKKIFSFFISGAFIIIFLVFLLLPFLLKKAFDESVINFFYYNKTIPYALLIWTFLLLINNFTANAVLLTNNKQKLFRNAQVINLIVVLISFIMLIKKFGILGASVAMCIGEIAFSIIIFNTSYKFLFKKNISYVQ